MTYSLAVDPAQPSTIYCGTYNRGVYKSLDGGTTWNLSGLDLKSIVCLAMDPSNPQILYAGTDPYGVWKTTDGGATWNPRNGGVPHPLLSKKSKSLAVDPSNPNTLYAGTLYTSATAYGVWVSYDAGAGWLEHNAGLPGAGSNLAVNALLVAGGTVYAGVVYSTNEARTGVYKLVGGSWEPSSAGLPASDGVLSLGADRENENVLYAGCQGSNGAFRSTDGGSAWHSLNGPRAEDVPTGVPVRSLAWNGQRSTLFAGTFDDGVKQMCDVFCYAKARPSDRVGCPVEFTNALPTRCTSYSVVWSFGDGSISAAENPTHTYTEAGNYNWLFSVYAGGELRCSYGGQLAVCEAFPGDCDQNGTVTIGEIQRAVNMFLGTLELGCQVDCPADHVVSVGEVQKVINAFLEIPAPCGTRSFENLPGPSFTLGAAEGSPGQTVSVPVSLAKNGAGVVAAGLDVLFDPAVLAFEGVDASPVAGLGFGAPQSLPAPGRMRFGLFREAAPVNLPDGVLAYLRFGILPGATGTTPLGAACGASDAEGNDLPAACAEGSVTVPTLRGTVTLGGAGLAGVTVAAGPYSVVTDASGAWAAGGVAAGSYTVMPSRAGYAFAPASRSVAFGGGVLSGIDFAASENFSIAGVVTFMDAGTPVPGVALEASRAEGGLYTATTGGSGAFRFEGLPSGSYTLTPGKTDTLFSPARFGAVPLSGEWPAEEGVSFRAFPAGPYRISGFARQDGAPLAGARLRLEGWPQEATANELGYYAIGSLAAGYDYTVLPSMRCKRFNPAYLNVFGLAGDVGGQHFAASPVQLCQPCFGVLDLEMARCLGSPDPAACSEGARLRFAACLDEATRNANSALFGATMLAIAVPRATGQPVPVTVPLAVAEEGDYFINVANGDQANKETMASSATIDLAPYGRVFGPNDFNKTVPFLSAPVHLLPGAYELTVEVRSQPESYLTLVVSDADFGTLPPEGE